MQGTQSHTRAQTHTHTHILNTKTPVRPRRPPAAEVYEQHLLSTPQMRTLQSVSDTALDEAGVGLLDWKLLEPYCQMRGVPLLMQKLGVRWDPLQAEAAARAALGPARWYSAWRALRQDAEALQAERLLAPLPADQPRRAGVGPGQRVPAGDVEPAPAGRLHPRAQARAEGAGRPHTGEDHAAQRAGLQSRGGPQAALHACAPVPLAPSCPPHSHQHAQDAHTCAHEHIHAHVHTRPHSHTPSKSPHTHPDTRSRRTTPLTFPRHLSTPRSCSTRAPAPSPSTAPPRPPATAAAPRRSSCSASPRRRWPRRSRSSRR